MNENIAFICDHWQMYGEAFFEKYSDFVALIQAVDAPATYPAKLLTLAKIAERLGDHARSKSFAAEALTQCPEPDSRLHKALQQFLRDVAD